jgi:hypothetical protein
MNHRIIVTIVVIATGAIAYQLGTRSNDYKISQTAVVNCFNIKDRTWGSFQTVWDHEGGVLGFHWKNCKEHAQIYNKIRNGTPGNHSCHAICLRSE